jgi:hypothetical protein
MYLFFSSDIYTLYKKDVLSAISLPEEYCIHFRYPKSLIPPQTLNSVKELIEKEGVIVYVTGNDYNRNVNDRNISFFPLRNVRVKNAYFERGTELLHVFLKLGAFIESSTLPIQVLNNANQDIPPHKFIFNVPAWTSNIAEWHQKVKGLVAFDNDFNNHLFFNVNIRYAEEFSSGQVEISYDRIEDSSYFELLEDKNYMLDVAIYNSSQNINQFEDYTLKLFYDSDDFFVTNPENISIGADADNRKYKLVTKDINSPTSSAYLKFQSFKMENDRANIIYDELVRINIKRSSNKVLRFIIFNMLGIAGTFLLAYSASQITNTNANKSLTLFIVFFSILMMGISAVGQFYYFNKRN